MTEPFTSRHRGPYQLLVIRPFKTKVGFYRSEWLSGETQSDEVMDEVDALLTDPRDNISSIHIWSIKEEQFVWGKAS